MKKNVLKQNRFINSQRHYCRWPGTRSHQGISSHGMEQSWFRWWLVADNSKLILPGSHFINRNIIYKKTADTLLLCHKIHVLQTHIFRSLQNKTDVSKVNAYICREIRCHGFVICVCIRSDIAHDTLGITDRLSQRQPRSSGAVAMTACCYENRLSLLRSQCTRSVPTRL